jgi:hypothetical protein
VFASYLVLDALIGNTDRHHMNWGVLDDPGSPRVLAPTFDHASSLGFLLSDEQRNLRLDTTDPRQTVEAYASRSEQLLRRFAWACGACRGGRAGLPQPCGRRLVGARRGVQSRQLGCHPRQDARCANVTVIPYVCKETGG